MTATTDVLADQLDDLVADAGLLAALAVVAGDDGRPVVVLRCADDLPLGSLDRSVAAIRTAATLATR